MRRESSIQSRGSSRVPRRAIVVGLGRAAALTLAALAERRDVEVVAGVDPRGGDAEARLPAGARVAPTIDGLPAAELVVVATPTPTHVDVCEQVLERCAGISALLCEKPVALSAHDVERLLAASRARNVELRSLLHYAFAPEALWLASRLPQLGKVSSFQADFEDPYSRVLADRTAALGTSWLDSGINALSVLARLVRLDDVVAADVRGAESAEVELRFTSGAGVGTGVVRTSWLADRPRKTTRLVLADGGVVELDHDAGTVTVAGRVVYRSGTADPRLERYRLMLAAELDEDASVPTAEHVVHLHRLLERAL